MIKLIAAIIGIMTILGIAGIVIALADERDRNS